MKTKLLKQILGPDADKLTPTDLDFLSCVTSELVRARGKFPSSIHSFAALVEEVGELGKALISEGSDEVHAEAMQTAVMAVRVAVEGDASFAVYRNMKGL
jgi:ABC-type hemin transport system ATPase subunit